MHDRSNGPKSSPMLRYLIPESWFIANGSTVDLSKWNGSTMASYNWNDNFPAMNKSGHKNQQSLFCSQNTNVLPSKIETTLPIINSCKATPFFGIRLGEDKKSDGCRECKAKADVLRKELPFRLMTISFKLGNMPLHLRACELLFEYVDSIACDNKSNCLWWG